MITTEEAKKIGENIRKVVLLLNGKVSRAAEKGLDVKLMIQKRFDVDYPYDHVAAEHVAIDLDWISPEETEELIRRPDEEDAELAK